MAEKKYILGMELDQLRRDKEKAKSLFSDLGRDVERTGKQIDNTYFSIGKTVAGAFSIAAITSFGKQLIDVAGQSQTFRAVLTNTLGDPIKAGNAMEMIQEFAATTPFQVDALTGSFVKLANQGFTPTMQQMTLLGDLASSTGKGFDQLTEAIIDAQTGEFERLKEFGIRASKEGDSVTFSFKEQQTQVDFTASSIRDYILSLGELEGVQGANAAIAATLTGQMSNLQDGITQMMNEIGQSSSGVLSGAISSASYLVDHYEEVGKVITSLIATYGTYKTAVLVVTTVEKLRYQATLAQMAGMTKMQAIMDVLRAKTAALNKTMLTNPYVLLATAVVALGAALWMLSDNTDKVAKKMEEFNEKQDKIRSDTEGLVGIIQSETTTMYQKIKAYDELITKSDALAKAYTLEKLMSGEVSQSEIGVILNKQREADEYKELIKIRNEAQKIYTELSSSPEGGFNVSGITEAKRDLDGANKAIDEYNSRIAKAQQIAKNGVRLEGIEENITLITKESSTIDERTTAYEKLKELSPELASNYDQEAMSLMTLAQAQEAASRAEQIATLQKEKIANKKAISSMEDLSSGSYFGNPLQSVIDDKKLKNSSIDQQIADLRNKPLPTTPTDGNYGEEYQAARKAWEKAKKELKEVEDDRNKFTTEVYNNRAKAEAEAKKAYEALGGDTSTKKKEEKQEVVSPIAGTIEAYEADNNKLREQQTKFIKTSEEFAALQKKIDANNKKIGILDGSYESDEAKKTREEKEAWDERLKNFQTFADRYAEIDSEFETNKKIINKKGGTQADYEANEEDRDGKLQELNEEVLSSVDGFESMTKEATDRMIDEMIANLLKARAIMEASGDADPTKIQAINSELERLGVLKEKNEEPSNGRTLKEWQDMEKQLNDCTDSFEQMGEAIGGVAGEVISTAGGIVSSTVSMVSSIAQLVDISINGTKAAAEGASTAIRAVESASVILAVISAVIQVATKIANLFNANKQAEEDHKKALLEVAERNIDAQTQYNALLREEAVLLAERNTIFSDDPYSAAIAGTERYSDAMQELRSAIKGSISEDELRRAKIPFFGGRNATQRLLESYQSGTKGLNDIKIVTGSHTKKSGLFGWGKKQVDDYSSITSVYSDLVDQYGNLNTERAQTIIDTQRMSEEDKKRLKSMISLQEEADEADEAIKGINDYYNNIFGDMGSSLKDSLVDAFRNGTEAGEEFCKNMVSMLEQLGEDFAYSMSIGQVMADQQAKVDEINRDSTLTDQERAKKMMALAIETGEKAAAQQDDFNAFLEAYQQGAENEGYNLWEADGERKASSKGIATASQDSVDENNGRLTAIQGHTFSIAENVLRMRELAEIGAGVMQPSINLESGSYTPTLGEDIRYLRENAGKMLTTVMGIKDDTAHLSRLQKIETDMGSVKTSLNNMEIKGIKIKL